MPLFYFDIVIRNDVSRDDEGSLCEDLNAVRREAIALLPQLARDELPDGDSASFSALVRDADNQPVLQAELTLSTRWFVSR